MKVYLYPVPVVPTMRRFYWLSSVSLSSLHRQANAYKLVQSGSRVWWGSDWAGIILRAEERKEGIPDTRDPVGTDRCKGREAVRRQRWHQGSANWPVCVDLQKTQNWNHWTLCNSHSGVRDQQLLKLLPALRHCAWQRLGENSP